MRLINKMAGKLERRSRRQKKTINYRQILDNESGLSDDDFADPPPKRTKKKVTETAQPVQEEKSTIKRLSREEKMYNRAIEETLKVSKTTTPIPTEVQSVPEDQADNDFVPDSGETLSTDDACSDVSDSDPPPPSRAKSSKKARKNVTSTTKSNQKRLQNNTSSKELVRTAPLTVSTDSDGTSVTVPSKPLVARPEPSAPTTQHSKPPHNTQALGVARKFPKWTPPSQVMKGTVSTVKPPVGSSGSPVIRVGLSRHAKVKPLHTNRTI